MTGMTAMEGFQPVGENGAYPEDDTREGFEKTIEHMVWKDRFSISREAVDDGKLMDFRKQPAAFIKGYYRTRELFGAAMYAGAINRKTSIAFRGRTFGLLGADKRPILHGKHPSALADKKETQCNVFSDAFSASALGKL